ncbi:UbiA family prenyltransferase [Nocardia brasiliensis]|uniref:UbiA family prenyltransferase n=1 Tax=Nocardia brasiliensis TaxID=37326 RepID=UPI00114D1546|nr:UbiA family prenyltransferase [Nocardia brasiliensis]
MHDRSAAPTISLKTRRLLSVSAHEIRTTCTLFSLDNTFITLVPGVTFTVSVSAAAESRPAELFNIAAGSMLYFFLYGYFFTLSNQIAGLEEDRLNKPHRPLVRGLVDVDGMRRRLIGATAAFILTGWLLGVIEWALIWVAISFMHNQLHWSRNWIFKNITMLVGIIAMLAAGASLANYLNDTTWRWIVVISAANFALVSLQDLRDTAGDEAVGRRTFPQYFGINRTRILLAIGFIAYPALLHCTLYAEPRYFSTATVLEVIIAIFSAIISLRIATAETARADHITYVIYCYQYCLILASPALVI